jgi:Zn-dependent protease
VLILFDLSPAGIITRAIVLLVAVVVHEYAHAYVAFTQGDTTAYEQGRMTLDPRANVWWPGFLIGVLFGFAILGSAPVNPYRMRNPRLGMLLAVAAGPFSNLLLAALFAVPVRFGLITPAESLIPGLLPSLSQIFETMVLLNVLLFIFNLLPLSPLDGWTVVLSLLPPRQAIWWERNRQNSMYVLFGLIILGFVTSYIPALGILDILEWVVFRPAILITRVLLGL